MGGGGGGGGEQGGHISKLYHLILYNTISLFNSQKSVGGGSTMRHFLHTEKILRG